MSGRSWFVAPGAERFAIIGGMRVHVSPDRPNYVLPEEVCPGVPWPPGFRAEINAWAFATLGTWNVVQEGQALHDRINDVVHVTPRGYEALLDAAGEQWKPGSRTAMGGFKR